MHNFDNISEYIKNKSEKALVCSNKPLLHEIEKIYTSDIVTDLIVSYLFKFQTLLNIKDEYKLDSHQMLVCARNIIPLLRGLTMAEVVMMFNRFLSGEFGHFYGNIDIMTIGEWVRLFKHKRGDFILKNKEVRKFVVKRDQNYDEDEISWRIKNNHKLHENNGK